MGHRMNITSVALRESKMGWHEFQAAIDDGAAFRSRIWRPALLADRALKPVRSPPRSPASALPSIHLVLRNNGGPATKRREQVV